MSGTLYIVATPIGNLEDLTARARQTLATVDLIAAEDTRHTGRLLSVIGAKKPLMSLHDFNEAEATGVLLRDLEAGRDVALVSDAGTPLVSDPGYRLVLAAHEAGIRVSPIPGPSALVAALSVSGLPTDRFSFEGFLPAKSKARRTALEALRGESRTLVFYESVHRIGDFLADAADAFGSDRLAFLGRELTKVHEQGVRATIGGLVEALQSGDIPARGEFVIAIAGAPAETASDAEVDTILSELAAVLPHRQAAATAARLTGRRRNELYARLLELGKSSGS